MEEKVKGICSECGNLRHLVKALRRIICWGCYRKELRCRPLPLKSDFIQDSELCYPSGIIEMTLSSGVITFLIKPCNASPS